MRITNKIIDNYSVYNLNTNKGLLDDLNTQMSTRKKINDPTKDPVTGVTSLRFRGSLSEYAQYLGKNVTDAVSWTESTQSAIDTAKELMRSLKAEYTSASNGTNESTDRWTYYDNMVNLVNEYFSVGDTTNENRFLFSGARTGDSLTFSEKNFADRAKDNGGIFIDIHKDTFKYMGITESFTIDDVESYSFTARDGKAASGITDDEIADVKNINTADVNETAVQNKEAFRIRLAYENLDEKQEDYQKYKIGDEYYAYKDEYGNYHKITHRTLIFKDDKGNDFDLSTLSPAFGLNLTVTCVENDWDTTVDLDKNQVYLNTTTGNLIFGSGVQAEISRALEAGAHLEYQYCKSVFEEGDVKPEHYFPCIDAGFQDEIVYNLSFDQTGKQIRYNEEEQDIYYNVGEGQQLQVNVRAEEVFAIDARRDLNELRDALTAVDDAQKKIDKLKEMQEDSLNYNADDQEKIADLLRAVTKEYEYAKSKADTMLSSGITRSGNYFDVVNLAGTEIGTAVNRLNLIKNRLTEHQSTTTAQASDNENIDIATLAVQVNSATLSFSAALQITGKISQQSLVNYL